MKGLILLVVVAAGLSALAAAPADAAFKNCGKLSAGGRTWTVTAVGLTCPAAKSVVHTLAAKPLPRLGHYAGRYLGMGCLGGKRQGRIGIECGGTGGKLIVAFATG